MGRQRLGVRRHLETVDQSGIGGGRLDRGRDRVAAASSGRGGSGCGGRPAGCSGPCLRGSGAGRVLTVDSGVVDDLDLRKLNILRTMRCPDTPRRPKLESSGACSMTRRYGAHRSCACPAPTITPLPQSLDQSGARRDRRMFCQSLAEQVAMWLPGHTGGIAAENPQHTELRPASDLLNRDPDQIRQALGVELELELGAALTTVL